MANYNLDKAYGSMGGSENKDKKKSEKKKKKLDRAEKRMKQGKKVSLNKQFAVIERDTNRQR